MKPASTRMAWLVMAALVAPVCLQSQLVAAENQPAGFPIRDGDRIVFMGDSITVGGSYASYIETYLLTRFPDWKLWFRNDGWPGNYAFTAVQDEGRHMRRMCAVSRPTVVTLDFGMNDGGFGAFDQGRYDQHIAGMRFMLRQLKAAGIRPVVISESAFEKREQGDVMAGCYNEFLAQMSAGDAALAGQENAPFVDQLQPFAAALNRLRSVAPSLRLSSDTVHPELPGHLMMADFILTGLNAPPLVSSASIDAKRGKVLATANATVSRVVRDQAGISFMRLDRALVFPIEPAARPALQVVPVCDDLNQYLLQVTQLEPGMYAVLINGVAVTRYSAAQLAAGVNLAWYDSPLSAKGLDILRHVRLKNALDAKLFRDILLKEPTAREADAAVVADLKKQIAAEEETINALRRPEAFKFQIQRVVPPAARQTSDKSLVGEALP